MNCQLVDRLPLPCLGLMMGLLWSLFPAAVGGAPFPIENGETVLKQAVVQVSPVVVRIETVGGVDVVEGELAGTGPTTGLIVSADGYVVTSSFNFAARPSSILVTLPDTTQRVPADVVAHDELKQLTLLKIDTQDLPVARPVPLDEIRVGQWCLAVGRTYDVALPNVSLGLVSALGRVEGKAIQTDAKVSPANYGGPLIDLEGRVLGILAPLSPSSKGVTEGMNWYDSGIGFAVPLVEILETLERLKTGTDLKPGLMGVSFKGTPAFLTETVIQEVRPGSPAATAGLQKDDRIAGVEGVPVKSVAGMRQILGRKYAGDVLKLNLLRGEEEIETELTLAEKLKAFHFGWLGVLTSRDLSGGVVIEYVFPDSPAARAELKKRDVITGVAGNSIQSFAELSTALLMLPPEETVQLTVRSGETPRDVEVTLGTVPDSIPAEVPSPVLRAAGESTTKTGELKFDLPNTTQSFQLFVPEGYHPDDQYGCLIWLAASGEPIPAAQLAEWKRICRTRGYLLLMPTSPGLQAWSGEDTAWLLDCLADVKTRYAIQPEMVCVIASGNNPIYTWQLALEHRDQIHGLVGLNLPARLELPYNEPGKRLQVLLAPHTERELPVVPKITEYLQKEAFPVTTLPLKAEPDSEAYDAIGRWLEFLGSL